MLLKKTSNTSRTSEVTLVRTVEPALQIASCCFYNSMISAEKVTVGLLFSTPPATHLRLSSNKGDGVILQLLCI